MTLGFDGVHHRCFQRHHACQPDCAQHGDQVGPVRKLGPLMYAEEEGEVFLGRRWRAPSTQCLR